MLSKEKIITALDLYFHFNFTEGSDSAEVFLLPYNDRFFRWYKDSFRHGKKLTVLVDENKIMIMDTIAMRERLLEMTRKVTSNDEKTIFGCHIEIVKDLILGGVRIDKFNEVDEELIERMKVSEKDATSIILEKDGIKLNKGI